jgi:hypothetical protein
MKTNLKINKIIALCFAPVILTAVATPFFLTSCEDKPKKTEEEIKEEKRFDDIKELFTQKISSSNGLDSLNTKYNELIQLGQLALQSPETLTKENAEGVYTQLISILAFAGYDGYLINDPYTFEDETYNDGILGHNKKELQQPLTSQNIQTLITSTNQTFLTATSKSITSITHKYDITNDLESANYLTVIPTLSANTKTILNVASSLKSDSITSEQKTAVANLIQEFTEFIAIDIDKEIPESFEYTKNKFEGIERKAIKLIFTVLDYSFADLFVPYSN